MLNNLKKNLSQIHIFFFVVLLVINPLIYWFKGVMHKEYFIIAVGLWGISVVVFEKLKKINYNIVDLLVVLYSSYEFLQFIFFSEATLMSIHAWQRVSFSILYLILRSLYHIYGKIFLKQIVFVFNIKILFEIGLGVLQSLDIINTHRSNFFTIIGTFTTPNFFGYVLAIGLLVILWIAINKFKVLKAQHKYALVAISLISIVLLITTKSRTAFIGLVTCFILLLIIKNRSYLKKINLKIKLISILTVLITGIFGGYWLYNIKKGSADGRFLIAKITANEVIKKPLFGHGFYSFAKGYNMAKGDYLIDNPNEKEIEVADFAYSALNDYLEIIYETGFVGILLLLIILLVALKQSNNSDYTRLGILITAFLCIAALFSSVHRNDNLVVMGIMGFVLLLNESKSNQRQIGNAVKISLSFVFVTLISLGVLKLHTKGKIFAVFKDENIIENISEKKWKDWTYICSNHGLSEFTYGKYLFKHYDKKEKGLEVMEESLSKNIEPKNVKRLAYYYLELEKYSRAQELFELNESTQPFRFEPKMDLLKSYIKTNQKALICKKANEVIGYPVKIPSEKTEKYKRISRSVIEKNDCKVN